ncbi:hypothetical protein PAMP_019118 [Pampus punctatissimus]
MMQTQVVVPQFFCHLRAVLKVTVRVMDELRRILDKDNSKFISEVKKRWADFCSMVQFYGVWRKVLKPPMSLGPGHYPHSSPRSLRRLRRCDRPVRHCFMSFSQQKSLPSTSRRELSSALFWSLMGHAVFCQLETLLSLHLPKKNSAKDELDDTAQVWNAHTIRPLKNRNVPSGRPNVMYALPELYGTRDFLSPVENEGVQLCKSQCVFRQTIPCNLEVYEL